MKSKIVISECIQHRSVTNENNIKNVLPICIHNTLATSFVADTGKLGLINETLH